MTPTSRRAPLPRWRRRLASTTLALSVSVIAALATGCLERQVRRVEPKTTSTESRRLPSSAVDKIDLLLVIDNSLSMADKQAVLGDAVPDLTNRLVNPPCVGPLGRPVPDQPTSPLEACPDPESEREFPPLLDMHIGVITSSLGGYGGTGCQQTTENDRGRLIARDEEGGTVATYDDLAFLAWDPDPEAPTHDPPGERDRERLIDAIEGLVRGAGEDGCGYEGVLESWYRFLVDPDPYERVEVTDDGARLVGTDATVLAQREAFLRPDSLVAVIMLSDENDCSVAPQRAGYAMTSSQPLPKPRAACAVDPNDPCCVSCGQPAPAGCDTSEDDCLREGCVPTDEDDCLVRLSSTEDPVNLRCFDQKRRFGYDFLHPVDRYVRAMQDRRVENRAGELVPNPLLEGEDGPSRDPSLVFVAGIVGVPWEDIARRNDAGAPDLIEGHDADGRPVGGYLSAREMRDQGIWELILGDPAAGTPPSDPLMIESVTPRSGTHPVTGEPLRPPGQVGAVPNAGEFTDATSLQHACVFPLVEPRDCTGLGARCDCSDNCTSPDSPSDNPVCVDPASPEAGPGCFQHRAKAFPGVRQLQVLQGLGDQGIVGSICPAQIEPGLRERTDYGYRPAMGAIVDRLKTRLNARQCLSRSLQPDEDDRVQCEIIEALEVPAGTCARACDRAGREPVAPDDPAVANAVDDPAWNCFCRIPQLREDALTACQESLDRDPVTADGNPAHGWCYLDASTVPPIGDPRLVECPPTEQRSIRFVGDGKPATGATALITCQRTDG